MHIKWTWYSQLSSYLYSFIGCVMFRSSKTPSYDSSREALLKQRRRGSTVAATSSKGKPSAFNQSHSQSKGKRPHSATVSKEPKVRTIREVEDDDDDLNSGFGSYMRSGEGKQQH